ncbi:MAG: hypothetical protein JO297_01825 [Nitrososphaeraceae archaeon]|nr:hypothetical protein [Nitrososphaeraceae archaeon]
MTSCNINNSKYLCITDVDRVDGVESVWDVVDSGVVVLNALWILSPKINDDVPIKNETTARIFPVIAGTITGSV